VNQIPYLTPRRLADGTIAYDWRPSPKWRRLGHKNTPLGTNKAEAFAAAIRLNEALGQTVSQGTVRAAPAPAAFTFAQLVQAYLGSHEFQYNEKDRKPKSPDTQKHYRWALGRLERLTTLENGHSVTARYIDEDYVAELKAQLRNGSPHSEIAILTMLRILTRWAKTKKLIALDPCTGLKISGTEKRKKRVLESTIIWLTAWLEPRCPELALAVDLAFYSTQRQGDLLALTKFNWGELHNMDSVTRSILAGPDGRVMGIRLRQNKTGEPIEVAMSAIRPHVEREIARRETLGLTDTHLIGYPNNEEDRGCNSWILNRTYRHWHCEAIKAARNSGSNSLVEELFGLTFRDLRRSGMCWLRNMGCTIPQIASISGHSIAHTTTILDTYMPKDSRASNSGMAHAMAKRAEIAARDAVERGEG
jgi:integrase